MKSEAKKLIKRVKPSIQTNFPDLMGLSKVLRP